MNSVVRASSQKSNDYAEFSKDGLYRYVLKRNIEIPYVCGGTVPMLFIMLNPSVATEVDNDPTIRRCISFAKRELCLEMYVVNLFAFRSPDPKFLKGVLCPMGPANGTKVEEMILKVKDQNGLIVAAWGASEIARNPGMELTQKFGPFLCLGTTKHGAPRHPLYVKSRQPLVPYNF